MDVIFWKAGVALRPLSIAAPTSSSSRGQTPDACEAQLRSGPANAHRSGGTQLKASSPATSTLPSTSLESSNATFGPSVTPLPLPLPPSRSLLPAPLKFLWFNKRNQNQPQETNNPDLFLSVESSVSDERNDEASCACIPDCRRNTDQPCDKEIQSDISLLTETDPIAKLANEDIHENMDGETETSTTTGTYYPENEDLGQRDESTSENADARGWAFKFLDFKSFWQDIKKHNRKVAPIQQPLSSAPDSCGASTGNPSATVDIANGSGSASCELGNLEGCTLEVAHVKVHHDRESFSKFLQDLSLFEVKIIAQMSFLCNLAYMIPDIKPGELLKYHRLRFITSSLIKKAEAEKRDEAAAKAKDLNASSDKPPAACKANAPNKQDNGAATRQDDAEDRSFTTTAVVPEKEPLPLPHEHSEKEQIHCSNCRNIPRTWQVEKKQDTVGDSSVLAGRKSGDATNSMIYATLKGDVDHQVSDLLEDALLKGRSYLGECPSDVASLMAAAPVTAVMVAEEETKQAVAKDLHSPNLCPCEWFICDDESSHTRFFVIQGSESLASWQANLSFEPTKFEGLGVLVHRGIYEAAKGLYEQVLPEVLSHFKAHGDLAQVRFTGHSLGGSLSTLIALMLQIRKVLPQSAILPVITFGAPFIICGGDYLLERLGLPPNHIQSVVMHRDIVPRAFACDYPDHVAEVLKRLNGSFRDHPCLNHQRLLYPPMGQMLILQPDQKQALPHPLLPMGGGLYLVRNSHHGQDVGKATQLRAAQRAFLNKPHPLEILSDPGAYGSEGGISRNHDPRCYSKTINAVLRQELKRLRRIQREQRRQFWWPLVTAESSLLVQRGVELGVNAEGTRSGGALTPAVGKPALGFRQSVTYAISERFEFPLGSGWASHKDTFSRYARLIASQHVQLGMIFILSVRMLIVEGLSAVIVWM